MLDEKFVILAVLINFLGGLSYLVATLKGKTKPNKVTWFIWAVAPLIAFWSEIDQGVGIQSLMTFMVGFNPLLIFLASFVNKKAYWKVSRLDWICGSLALSGLVAWKITDVGNVAILFSIFADTVAAVPTLVKSYREPETENSLIFLGGGISAGITLLTIDHWNFEHYAFPAYILVICVLLYVLIKFKIGKKFAVKS